ncbi:hypothetical protein HN011_002165 [Eciton burchellii]|nr:hypothetical protein HN011_002165 [Eciton burchellii]
MYEDCVLQSMRFPQKLWRIVNECETGAIRWGVYGDTILLDYRRFQAEYLDAQRPIFKTNNLASFIRQLNLYGFRKVTSRSRDPICNSCDPYVYEFLHDNFRINRIDLLSKVCRKTGGKSKCSQYNNTRNVNDNLRLKANCLPRLKQCQLALTKTLEQITQEYRREHEKKSIIIKNNVLTRINKYLHNTVVDMYDIEFNGISD